MENELTNKIHMFDTNRNKWFNTKYSESKVGDEILPAMNFHSAVLYNSQMIVFGGKRKHDSSNEVWMLDISGMKLEADELLIPSKEKSSCDQSRLD